MLSAGLLRAMVRELPSLRSEFSMLGPFWLDVEATLLALIRDPEGPSAGVGTAIERLVATPVAQREFSAWLKRQVRRRSRRAPGRGAPATAAGDGAAPGRQWVREIALGSPLGLKDAVQALLAGSQNDGLPDVPGALGLDDGSLSPAEGLAHLAGWLDLPVGRNGAPGRLWVLKARGKLLLRLWIHDRQPALTGGQPGRGPANRHIPPFPCPAAYNIEDERT